MAGLQVIFFQDIISLDQSGFYRRLCLRFSRELHERFWQGSHQQIGVIDIADRQIALLCAQSQNADQPGKEHERRQTEQGKKKPATEDMPGKFMEGDLQEFHHWLSTFDCPDEYFFQGRKGDLEMLYFHA